MLFNKYKGDLFMGILSAEKLVEKQFSPKEIRDMLGIDNSQIQALCKFADIKLKKNDRGLTYFTDEDVKTLKNVSMDGKIKYSLPVSKSTARQPITAESLNKVIETLKNIEKSMTQKVTNILDEKLDGMDDVVMELIRVKSENETMRFKINELNKENYKLKKEINSFKKIPFGFYTKTTPEINLF